MVVPSELNDIKITFFPLMPELFVRDNYIISANYDKTNATTSGSFNTEVLISDFNEVMNIGMKQRDDESFGFNIGELNKISNRSCGCIHHKK